MVDRDLQLVSLPKLFILEIIIQEDVNSICEVRTMERNTDGQEPDMEDGFALGERDFAESSNKTIESTRRASGNECLDTLVEGDAKLGVFVKILVSCSDMAF